MAAERLGGGGDDRHFGGGGDVQSVVKRLRRKLDDLGCSLRIQPVRGVGLRLVDTAVPADHR